MGDGVFRFDMYMQCAHPVRMADITLTEMRKDLFRIVDEMIGGGEPVRIRRGNISVELTARVVEKPDSQLTRAERFDRWVAKGPRPGFEDSDYDHTDKSHRVWDPDREFNILRKP
ncbi:hypothetical protein KOAAANKH_01484 [Brevundimonas sp. NIBR10]|nr:hypothetical protein KOAAANKH_01484 [Brevundimonas sp. NIBR10]